jgi:hypothetical protein
MNETFLPGKWKDLIDVNDFINLNKKPFFEETFFLKKSFSFNDYIFFLDHYLEKDEILDFPNENLLSIHFLNEELSSFLLEQKKFPFPFAKEKDFSELFFETASLSLKNASRIGLLEKNFGDHIPPIFSPDIRQLPLYGIKRIILSKRQLLKKIENDFQSPTWIEKRIDLFRQIEHLERFEQSYKFLSKEPANSTKEAMNLMLLSTIFAIKENPYTTFHIPSLIDFLDIYIEKDILRNNLNEEEAMVLITEFYTKFIFIHYFFKKKDINFLITETLLSQFPSKTSYRFLFFYESFQKHQFYLSVITQSNTPLILENYFDKLIKQKSPIRFVHKRLMPKKQFFSLSHLGFPFDSDKDIILFNKACELTKIFFLTLNGGKDVETNYNLVPVYQKFTGNDIEYDVFLENFVDFISQVFTIYSEANNLLMYLSEKYFSHPFRNSFKQEYQYYQYYFSFLNIDKLAIYLLAIKEKKFLLKKDAKNYITDFEITTIFSEEKISQMIIEIAYILEEEIQKTPYYQYGKPTIFLHLKKPLISPTEFAYTLYPPEMLSVRFIPENIQGITSYKDVLTASNLHILDLKL